MGTGSTFDATITRDELIQLSLKKVGAIGSEQPVPADMHADALLELDLLIHELSADEIYLHAQVTASLTLQANIFQYTSSSGLPTAMSELVTAQYRDSAARDTPIRLLTKKQYEEIENKTQSGLPKAVYLTDELTLSSRSLCVWPMLTEVNAQSVITGSDSQAYKCIRSHTAESVNYPITGANWRLFWELGGSSPATWASGTQYEAPELLRLTYLRPLYDFDAEDDNPDLPAAHANLLMYLFMSRIGTGYGVSLQECQKYESIAASIMARTFKRVMQKKTTEIHGKAKYF